ncbi:MAG: type II toxin-antitoxin system VapC family toxin [Anaerolineales bacterium]
MSNQYVLDSFAILALLQKERGHDRVGEILNESKKGTAQVMMTWVNLGEVAYTVQRRWDKSKVHQILANLEASNVEFVDAGQKLSLKAADYKAGYRIAYADTFAAALAEMTDFVLVTGDPEFKMLEERLSIEWL